MNEWPSGWARDDVPPPSPDDAGAQDATARLSSGAASAGAQDPTVHLRAPRAGGASAAGGPGSPGGAGGGGYGYGYSPEPGRGSAWPAQPPLRSRADTGRPGRPGPGGPGRPGGPGGPGSPLSTLRRRPRGRRVATIAIGVVAVLLVLTVGMYFFLDSKLTRVNVLTAYPGQPAAGAGQNWLITGSDSRQGLTRQQEAKLATGFDVSGHRSDTILLLHIPGNGGPAVLISLPRDSYVKIPGYGYNKINAAYSFGGPALLVRTVENATGLRIDHYMGIGFGGLVNVVNDVGGVQMCFPHRLRDRAAGLRLKKGCQTLTGAQALGFVRTRHQFATQDLQRVQNQRVFLKALLSKITSAGTMLNPFASIPAAFGAADALQVDQGTHLYQLIGVAFALRNPETTTVPVGNANYLTPVGDALQWNQSQANALFNDLRTDQPVPKSLLTGSQLADCRDRHSAP